MRKYNVENYIRYKEDVKVTLGSKLYERTDYENLTRDQKIIKFLHRFLMKKMKMKEWIEWML